MLTTISTSQADRFRGDIAAVDRPVSYTLDASSPPQRVEPVTLALVKQHLRFTSTSEDDLIAAWIVAARQYFEGITERQCVDAVYEYALDRCPVDRRIELPRPPLLSVESVVYDDAAGVEQTLDPDSYRVCPSVLSDGSPAAGVIDPYCPRGYIELVSGASWPTPIAQARSVRIRRTCGYGPTAADMPALVQAAIYLLVGHFFRNREAVTAGPFVTLPLGADLLIQGFKYTALPTLPPRWGWDATQRW